MDTFFIVALYFLTFQKMAFKLQEELITYKHEFKISYVQMLIKGCCWWHELQYIFVARGEFGLVIRREKSFHMVGNNHKLQQLMLSLKQLSQSILFFSSTAVIFNPPLKSPNSFLCQYDYWFLFFLFLFLLQKAVPRKKTFSVSKSLQNFYRFLQCSF